VRRFDQRQGFLVSAAIHLTLLMILIAHPPVARRTPEVDPATLEKKDLVFLPPASVIRQLAPKRIPAAPTQPAPHPAAPQPTPPPQDNRKDRISVGGPSALQAKGPMVLQRDTDLTKTAKGRPDAMPASPPAPAAVPTPPPPGSAAARTSGSVEERTGREGLRLPPGLFGQSAPAGDEGQRGRLAGPTPGGTALDRSVASAIDQVTRHLQSDSQLGIPTGTGRDVSGLHFDPQGADFTLWVQRFKDEVYRNWLVPQAVMLGFRGHVDFEFTVTRDGSVLQIRLLKSSGTPSLDRAAQYALSSSRYLPLPDDYRPARITMQVTFYYNEAPAGS
jgi:TonB family protein